MKRLNTQPVMEIMQSYGASWKTLALWMPGSVISFQFLRYQPNGRCLWGPHRRFHGTVTGHWAYTTAAIWWAHISALSPVGIGQESRVWHARFQLVRLRVNPLYVVLHRPALMTTSLRLQASTFGVQMKSWQLSYILPSELRLVTSLQAEPGMFKQRRVCKTWKPDDDN
jgi:hypothetical protein